MKITLLILVLIVPVLVVPGCRYIINRMAFHPDKINTISERELPDSVDEIFIVTKDSVRIQAYYAPDSASENLLIYFHGNAGNLSHRLNDLLKIREAGINVLGVEYRGYGKSRGSPSERGIYNDGEAGLDYAVDALGFDIRDIYIMGRSIGTCVALHTSGNREISGLILVSPLSSGREQARKMGLGPVSFLAGDSFNNTSMAEGVSSPVLLIHGAADRVVPHSMGLKVYKSIRGQKRMVTIPGAGHNDISTDYADEYWEPVYQFINRGL
ncbi:MAG: alpha/beta hydrolase [Chitinivibrionales bacterium]